MKVQCSTIKCNLLQRCCSATEACHARVQCCYKTLRVECDEPIQNPTIELTNTGYETTIEPSGTGYLWNEVILPWNPWITAQQIHQVMTVTSLLNDQDCWEEKDQVNHLGWDFKNPLLVQPPNCFRLQIGSASKSGILDIRARKGGLWKDENWNIYESGNDLSSGKIFLEENGYISAGCHWFHWAWVKYLTRIYFCAVKFSCASSAREFHL